MPLPLSLEDFWSVLKKTVVGENIRVELIPEDLAAVEQVDVTGCFHGLSWDELTRLLLQ